MTDLTPQDISCGIFCEIKLYKLLFIKFICDILTLSIDFWCDYE